MKYLKEMHYMDERYTNFLKDTLMQIGKSCSDLFKDRIKSFAIVILFRMGFFGAADGWGGGWFKLDETCHGYALPKEDSENI